MPTETAVAPEDDRLAQGSWEPWLAERFVAYLLNDAEGRSRPVADVESALVRLSGLDADEGARATAAGASASDVRSLSALLNKLHARIAAREAALSSDNASPDNTNTNA